MLPDGILYGSSPNGDLYRIDPITGTKTLLFNTGITQLSGLAAPPASSHAHANTNTYCHADSNTHLNAIGDAYRYGNADWKTDSNAAAAPHPVSAPDTVAAILIPRGRKSEIKRWPVA